ncbi:MAG: MBL fold metallo-hydrolase [Candidatus Ratteibacteria bacterium]|nr:MBL fold metallo-hydrolase [Candidatus Ratteibacteria bacterium]
MLENIKWLGHSSVLIEKEGRYIYIDPWKIKISEPKADVVLITHPHYDHYSPEDIDKIRKEETIIIGPPDVIEKIKGNTKKIKPQEEIELPFVKIKGVPAYNINKNFHPKSNNWVGYIIQFSDGSIYVTGDTDFIPEMKCLNVDIVLLPIGGTYTMDAEEAGEAVNNMNVKVAIPIHYGEIVGNKKDAERFASFVKNAEVKVLTT